MNRWLLLLVPIVILLAAPAPAQTLRSGNEVTIVGTGTPFSSNDPHLEVEVKAGAVVNAGTGAAIDVRGTEQAVFVEPTAQLLSTGGVPRNPTLRVGAGFVSNAGLISNDTGPAIQVVGSVTIVNSGILRSNQRSGVNADSTAGTLAGSFVTVINNGLIENLGGAWDAITFDAPVTGLVVNHGTIRSEFDGIFAILNNPGPVQVFNYGLIEITSPGAARDAVELTTGSVDNFGRIVGSDRGVRFAAAGAVVRNHGQISGTNAGVQFAAGGVLDNSGTIAGAIGVQSGGTATIVNRGLIRGTGGNAIQFTGGDGSVVELHAGSIVEGNIVGAGGAETLALLGGGTFGGNVLNFERLQVGGNWTLGGTVNFATRTDVDAGRLAVDGTLNGGPLFVHGGGTLGGQGTINAPVSLLPGGAMSPGNSIGTLTVNGNVEFQAGSTFVVEMAGRPESIADALVVGGGGVVTVRPGAVLRPIVARGFLRTGDRFQVVNAPAGIVGSFAVRDASAVIGVRPIQTATSLTLEIERRAYADVASTPNRRAVGRGLDAFVETATGDLRQVLNEIDRLEHDEFQLALESIDPEFHDVFREVGLMSYRSIAETVEGHLAGAGGQAAGVDVAGKSFQGWNALLADGGGREGETHRAPGFSVWAGAYGTFAGRDEETDVTEYEVASTGPRLGWDYRLADAFSIGMFAGVTISDVDFERSSDMTAEHEAYTLGFHGHFEHPGGLAATLMVYGGIDDYESRRVVRFGTIDRLAEADHDGYHVATRLSGEYVWSTGPFRLGPVLSLDYLHQSQDAFTERGAASLNLRVDDRDVDSFETGLGLVFRFADAPPAGEGDGPGLTWVPEFRARWVREWLDDDRAISAGLVDGPRFTVRGDDPTRDSAVLGVGFKVHDGRWFSFGLDYDAVLNEDVESHTLRGAFEIRF